MVIGETDFACQTFTITSWKACISLRIYQIRVTLWCKGDKMSSPNFSWNQTRFVVNVSPENVPFFDVLVFPTRDYRSERFGFKEMASDFLDEISHYNVRRAWPKPDQCALLVIDMQQYFLPIASPIVGNVLSVIEACRSKGIRVIFTRHGHRDISRNGGMLAKWWGDCIEYGSRKWELIKGLSIQDTDRILDKNRYSAFFGTDLDKSLRFRKIDELIVTGVMTNCCCETTARDGFIRDYRIFFVSDATATVDEELHVASMKNLAYGFAHILSTEELRSHIMNH